MPTFGLENHNRANRQIDMLGEAGTQFLRRALMFVLVMFVDGVDLFVRGYTFELHACSSMRVHLAIDEATGMFCGWSAPIF